jgi:hypothetical protein
LEAKYAYDLAEKKKLQMHFVMMESDYTNVSIPDCCDGWLGYMLGDSIWYPLWTARHVKSSARQIAGVLEYAKKGSESPSPASTTKSSVNYAAAYKLILCPDRSIDSSLESVNKLLHEWGVLRHDDLGDLSHDDILQLAACMKKVQRKKFLALFGIDPNALNPHDRKTVNDMKAIVHDNQINCLLSDLGKEIVKMKDEILSLKVHLN